MSDDMPLHEEIAQTLAEDQWPEEFAASAFVLLEEAARRLDVDMAPGATADLVRRLREYATAARERGASKEADLSEAADLSVAADLLEQVFLDR